MRALKKLSIAVLLFAASLLMSDKTTAQACPVHESCSAAGSFCYENGGTDWTVTMSSCDSCGCPYECEYSWGAELGHCSLS